MRGSAFPPRRSVSWTVRASDPPGGEDGKEESKTDKPGKPGAPPQARDGLGKEIGLLYGGSLVLNAIIGEFVDRLLGIIIC